MSFSLGRLRLRSRALLSPLEGVSDVGFRALCASQGAALVWTEMVRAQAIAKNNSAALDLIDTHDAWCCTDALADVDGIAAPTGVQLLAKSGDELRRALERIRSSAAAESNAAPKSRAHFCNIAAVDLNFGCPSPDVIGDGAGPALLKRRTKLGDIFAALAEWKSLAVPFVSASTSAIHGFGAVGVKIRLGLNAREKQSKVYLHVIEAAARAQLDYVCVHGRHAGQKSREAAEWAAIAECVHTAQGTGVQIIGNGDALNAAAAKRMLAETGCAAIMVARGAIRNPWIFNDLRNAVQELSGASSMAAPSTLPPLASASDSERWPTVSEVDAATTAYFARARQHATRDKYTEFHRQNFARLRAAAMSGDRSRAPPNAKSIHFS